MPAVGRSLFDHLVSQRVDGRAVYQVPFPFQSLRRKLLAELDTDAPGAPLKQVLIPLGRSLQRTAAAPDFFRYPRVVLAVDGETAAHPGRTGMQLKDRLYLGYLEKPGVLEVISYNEAAGRFEFQIVQDYRAGAEPRVVYANRAVCTACHQNATPIFARPLWSETNANRDVAALLQKQQRDYYGIPVRLGIDTPNAIDESTDRANLIPAVQFFWQQGCAADGNAGNCRGQALGFALQYLLTGSLGFARQSNPAWRQFADSFEGGLRRRWPQGFLLSDPDIPNRQAVAKNLPGVVPAQSPENAQLHRQIHIEPHFEPLRPRPPLEKWSADGSAQRFVLGLAGFFARVDVQRLDRYLSGRLGDPALAAGSRHYSRCRVSPSPRGAEVIRISLKCAPEGSGFSMRGRVYLKHGRLLRGVIDRLAVGHETAPANLEVSAGNLEQTAEGSRLTLGLLKDGLQARMPDGDALRSLTISWPADEAQQSASPMSASDDARGELALTEELHGLLQAARELQAEALSGRPFRRAIVLEALHAELGLPPIETCCSHADGMPDAVRDVDADDSGKQFAEVLAASTPERGFYRYCARCHRSSGRFPPNFLQGAPEQVRENLAHCAERIYLRLQMWELADPERVKTPMPPVHALQQLGLDGDKWRRSEELKDLQKYVHQLLAQQTGREPQVQELAGRGYENLRTCLARIQ